VDGSLHKTIPLSLTGWSSGPGTESGLVCKYQVKCFKYSLCQWDARACFGLSLACLGL